MRKGGQSWASQFWKKGPGLQSGCQPATILSLHPATADSLFNSTAGLFPPKLLGWCDRVWCLVAGASFHQGLQKEAVERSCSSELPGFRETPTFLKDEREKDTSLPCLPNPSIYRKFYKYSQQNCIAHSCGTHIYILVPTENKISNQNYFWKVMSSH